ncbi:carboxyphosphonoenolpyruvate mutase [Irpex rosettiformis]|uniref:Carboxyphosphonoenolpyruvate mutase n=1 Tax=Irpex rosettiformis TaxID=378272 RepID=A0ACB8UK25_9APHY|nr:carboxyphosphonoenolpyruvate mutase [Irpex rosettiformis]
MSKEEPPASYETDMPKRLPEQLKKGSCTGCPGMFEGILAHLANAAGFDALYLAGSGASGSVLANTVRMAVAVSSVPIIADADTGFGGPLNVASVIALYESTGVAGCHIEDQTFPKRSGQLSGKDIVDMETYLECIVAAVNARNNLDFVIIARTDARNAATFGGENADEEGFEMGVKRLKVVLKAGTDVTLIESPCTRRRCERLVKALHPHPVMTNISPNGLTGNHMTGDCTEMGFKLAIFPYTGFILAAIAMKKSYQALKKKGTDLDNCSGWQIKDFFELDRDVAEQTRSRVNPKKYESLSANRLF